LLRRRVGGNLVTPYGQCEQSGGKNLRAGTDLDQCVRGKRRSVIGRYPICVEISLPMQRDSDNRSRSRCLGKKRLHVAVHDLLDRALVDAQHHRSALGCAGKKIGNEEKEKDRSHIHLGVIFTRVYQEWISGDRQHPTARLRPSDNPRSTNLWVFCEAVRAGLIINRNE
jgi:hypothetical protein